MAKSPSATTKPIGRRRSSTAAIAPAAPEADAAHQAGSRSAVK
jgi:hypothetical protein